MPSSQAWSKSSRSRSFEQSEEEPGVAISDGRLLAARRQPLQPELAHRLQHPEARLALDALLLAQQALVDQRGNAVEDIERPLRVDDRLGRLQRAAAGEDGQAAEEDLLLRGEQVVTPGDGVAHRLLPRRERRGRLRVSSGKRCSRRVSSACGESILTQAAASSIASGSPSRRWQISATAGALALVTAKSGLTACARSTKRRTASYWLSRSSDGSCAGSGSGERRQRVLPLAADVQAACDS